MMCTVNYYKFALLENIFSTHFPLTRVTFPFIFFYLTNPTLAWIEMIVQNMSLPQESRPVDFSRKHETIVFYFLNLLLFVLLAVLLYRENDRGPLG